MRDFDTLCNFLIKKEGLSVTVDVLDGGEITGAIYSYVMVFCSFYIAKLSSVSRLTSTTLQKLYSTENMEQNLAWQICWLLKSEYKHATMEDLYSMAYLLLGHNLPNSFSAFPSVDRRIIDLMCTDEMYNIYLGVKKVAHDKRAPDNAIDRFFYKTGRGIKNTKTTIKESEVVESILLSKIFWIIILVGLIVIIGCIADALE